MPANGWRPSSTTMTEHPALNDCPAEPLLAEYAMQPLSEIPRGLQEHLESCRSCKRTVARYAALHVVTNALPSTATSARDLWPGISSAMRAAPRHGRMLRVSPARSALAAGIVLTAFLLGRVSVRPELPLASRARVVVTDSLSAAERIQEAGTRYLTALSLLGEAGVPRPARGQGREVAIATLYGATMELARQGRSSANLTIVASLLDHERNETRSGSPAAPSSR